MLDGPIASRKELADQRGQTRGDLMVQFIQTLKVPAGPDAGVLIRLRDWQINAIKEIYDPERPAVTPEGRSVMVRAVREAVFTIGRKNGKTSLGAGLCLGHMVGPEASWNAELYSAAYEQMQAALLYKAMASMIHMDFELRKICRCIDSSKAISSAVNNSRYKAVSAEARSKHGFNPTFVLYDELAQADTDRELYDVFLTSMGAQMEPLLLVTSTQGSDDNAVLSQLIDYGRDIKAGLVENKNDAFVLVDYSTPSDKELAQEGKTIWDEDVWYRANPALGDFRSLEEMRTLAAKAQRIPSVQMAFRNLYLNQRSAMRSSFVTAAVWELGSKTRGLEDLYGRPAMFALDLSSKIDLTALVIAVHIEEDDTYELITHAFTPADTMEDRQTADRADYVGWSHDGFLHAMPGKVIDYEVVARVVAEEWEKFDSRGLAYDRWRMDIIQKEMVRIEFIIDEEMFIPFGQGYKDMSPAIEAFEELLVSERLLHGGHPVLRWAIANAVLERDAAGNKKLTKAKSFGRIDPAQAAVMAVGALVRGIGLEEPPGIGYV